MGHQPPDGFGRRRGVRSFGRLDDLVDGDPGLIRLVETWWPEAIAPSDLADPALWEAAAAAHAALETHLKIPTA